MQHCALVAQLATRPSWPLNTQCDHHGLSPGVRGVERIPTQAGPPSPPPGTSNKTHIAVQFFNSSQIIPKNIAQLQIPSHPWLLMPLPVHRNSRKHIFQLKLSTKYSLFKLQLCFHQMVVPRYSEICMGQIQVRFCYGI